MTSEPELVFGRPLPNPGVLSDFDVAACAEVLAEMARGAQARACDTSDPRDAYLGSVFAWFADLLDRHIAGRLSAEVDRFVAPE
jgi:hypothetical protein